MENPALVPADGTKGIGSILRTVNRGGETVTRLADRSGEAVGDELWGSTWG